ncbi:PspC-related protein choline-binding protein 1 [Streptococcus pseudopneumoniae]|uniref:PspC-related protein choline-binding protein 1 n=1 Tax=Streptococcus pseudopneumoniae TaxID=257758 RepID=UPI001C65C709|nr:PspC-related protein choline-binding protein 1 [Streptococcus pseudopneumoniae]MBW8117444.1 PspC-related protein choline-binding protein 1 [Streptococcus pseudopneumoniae]
MVKSNTNKRYALRKLGKIFGSVIIGLTLFLGGVLNTSFVHADGADVTSELDDNFETQDNRKDIPYETIYERDDNLPKGTKETKTPGKKGIKATVKTYSSTTLQLVSEKSDVVILQPQTEVIKVGTKPTVVTETISSLIRYIKDDTRPVGSNVLTESDGEDGLRKITTTYDVNDKTGEVTIRETTSTIEKESKDIIYKVAAKDKVEKHITEKSTNIRFEKDESKARSENPVTIDGEDGYVTTTRTYDVNPENGHVTEKVTVDRKEATDTVIKVPAKSKVEREVLPTSVIRYEKDESRDRGASIEMIDGEDGYVTTTRTYDVNPENGKVTEKVTVDRKEATDTVIKVPAKSKVEREVLPTSVIRYEKDESKARSENPVTIDGEDGYVTTTTTYDVNPETGHVTEKVTVDRKEATDTVIKVPAKSKVEREVLPTSVIRFEKDESKARSENPVTIDGEDGYVTTTTTYDVNPENGKVTEKVTVDRKEPTDTVIKVPAKSKVEREVLPTSVIRYEKDESRDRGASIEMVDGEDGYVTTTRTYDVDSETGKVTEKVTVDRKEPTDTVIKVPAKSKVERKVLPTSVIRYEKDESRDRGASIEMVDGEDGYVTTTRTYDVNPETGKVSEKVTVDRKEATDTVIKVPAKDKVEKRIAEKSTNIRFEKDETRDRSENPVTIDGEDGYVITTRTYDVDSETGKVSEKVTVEKKEATDTVIKVPAKSKVEREVLPTSVIRFEKDETRDRSENPVTIDGEDGYVITTTTYDVDSETGKVTEKVTVEKKEATDTVIKVPAKSKVDREVLPTSAIRYEKDESRDRGASIEMVDGEDGYVTTTTTYDVNPETGKVREKVTVDRKEATDTVIKVPAKSKVDREVLPTSVIRYEKDETRDRGASIEMVDGEDGYVTTTTTYDVNPETGKVSEKVTVDRKEATDTVIKVPAKSKVDREVLPTSVIRYEKDESRDRGASIEMIDGEDGYVTTTRTYDVNPENGHVTEKVTVDRKEPTDTVIKVPAKSKVEEVLVPFATKYEADNDLSAGQEQEITLGKNGKTVTTITYDVDGKSGQVTESTLSQKEDSQTRVVKKGTKPQVLVQEIPIETEYLDDPTLYKGQEVEEAGEIGEITLTTIYTVDERDGTIEETTSRQITKEMVKRRIRRGTREPEKVVVPEQSSIPSYPVSVTSNQGTNAAVESAKPVAPTTGWKQENGMWYFYNTDGSMATGWVQVNGSWYYLNSNGSMATGWEQVNGSWYYLNDNGSMEIGWLQNNGSWYYLNSNGSMKANQWFQVGSKWYYVNASGELAINTSIDGYRVNDNGEWVR